MGEQRNLTEENVEALKKQLDEMQENNPDLTYRFFEKQKHVHLHIDNVKEIVDTLKYARIFIASREKMHQTGIEFYDKLLKNLQDEIKGFGF